MLIDKENARQKLKSELAEIDQSFYRMCRDIVRADEKFHQSIGWSDFKSALTALVKDQEKKRNKLIEKFEDEYPD